MVIAALLIVTGPARAQWQISSDGVDLMAALSAPLDFSAPAPAYRQERGTDAGAPSLEEHGLEEAANRIGVFLGGTTKSGETSLTISVEYERRLTDLIGVGGFVELLPDADEREWLLGIGVYFHPVGELNVFLGLAGEFEGGHADLILRTAVSWELELAEGFAVAPTAALDFGGDGEVAVVYGLVASFAF